MIEEAVYVGVDVAKSALDVAVTDSGETRRFANDNEGVSQAVHYIASVKQAEIILEATGNLEMPGRGSPGRSSGEPWSQDQHGWERKL